MGGVLSQPVELIRVQRRGSRAFKCAVAEMQGWRVSHEDAHAMHCNGSSANFWVLDGHGGDGAANFGAIALVQEIGQAMNGSSLPADDQIEHGFEVVDGKFASCVEENPQLQSGSTVVGALAVRHQDGTYSVKVLNCGDSRGLVLRRPSDDDGDAPPVLMESLDHKPDVPSERARIEAAGGFVCGDRVARVDGALAVSRGLGDFEFKDARLPVREQKVSCIPDVYELHDLEPGTILVLGCDGLWDVMSGNQVAQLVRTRLLEEPEADLGDLAAELVRTSLESQSGDNVTAMIVQLGDGSGWEDEPDEMKEFEKLKHSNALNDEVRQKYVDFLRRTDFPLQPTIHADTSRWILSKERP